MKKKTIQRHIHTIHWHGTMFLAIAAILLTSFKCSNEMLRALRAVPVPTAVFDNVYMRDVETSHNAIILNIGTRHATVTGK